MLRLLNPGSGSIKSEINRSRAITVTSHVTKTRWPIFSLFSSFLANISAIFEDISAKFSGKTCAEGALELAKKF